MEEEKIQDAEIVSATPEAANKIETDGAEVAQAKPEQEPAKQESPAEKNPPKESEKAEAPAPQPQVIIQKERGLAHYVGFVLLTVLAIVFFFIPGITVVYLVSCIAAITAPIAWIFGTILSVIVWLIFKLKIKGFKKSFLWYIGLCVIVTVILTAISVATSANVWAKIFALLLRGSN